MWLPPPGSGIIRRWPKRTRAQPMRPRSPSANSRARSSARSRIGSATSGSGARFPASAVPIPPATPISASRTPQRLACDAVIWRTTLQRMKLKPQEGLEVVAIGKLTTFPGKSSYQIVIEAIELARNRGADGAARGAAAETRRGGAVRRRAQAQGPVPAEGRRRGDLADRRVIRDILHLLADRFPVRVVVWRVRLREKPSPPRSWRRSTASTRCWRMGAAMWADVLIVARGGGRSRT